MTDHQAIDQFLQIQNKLYRFVLGLVKSTEEAEDIVQDTFIKMIETIRKKKDLDNFEAWCMTVARNRAFDILKKIKRTRNITKESAVLTEDKQMDFTIRDIQDERWEVVERCIRELPDHYREIILLRDVEGYRYKEISQMLDMSISQVKVSIHRARQHLKQKVLKKNI